MSACPDRKDLDLVSRLPILMVRVIKPAYRFLSV